MIRKQFAYFFTVSSLLVVTLAQQIGERCTIRITKVQGTCKLIEQCPSAKQASEHGVLPTICGFQFNTIPIVCCEENGLIQPNDLNPDSGTFVFPTDNFEPTPQKFSSKSEEKCAEYSKLVTGVVNAVALVTDPEEVSISIVKCDNNGIALIVGGSPALPGEFPFMAAVGYNGDDGIGWYCGGTLISDYYVVTAAHCANNKYYGPPIKVRLGDLDLKRENDGSEYVDYNIVDIKIHEQYRPPSRYNDIALIRLSPKVEITKFIRPACLWTKHVVEHNVTIATGWGKTGVVEEQSDKLLKVPLNVFDNSICSKSYPPNPRTLSSGITSTMMCVGDLKGGHDTCQGDSGGPIIVSKEGNRCISYIVGITSFGKGCGGPNIPAVYTRVSKYVPWIENIIW